MLDWTVRMMNAIIASAITTSTMPMIISTGHPPTVVVGPMPTLARIMPRGVTRGEVVPGGEGRGT